MPEKINHMAQAIYSTGKSTYDHLDNLLSWLRISGTEIPADLRDVELASLIDPIADMLQPVVNSKSLKLELTGPAKIKVRTDATMLRSILQNRQHRRSMRYL